MVDELEQHKGDPLAFGRAVIVKAAKSVHCKARNVLKRKKSRAYLLARLRREFGVERDEELRRVVDVLRRDDFGEPADGADDDEPQPEPTDHRIHYGREPEASDVWPYRVRQLAAVLGKETDASGVLELAKTHLGWPRNFTINVMAIGRHTNVLGYLAPNWKRWMKGTAARAKVLGVDLSDDGLAVCTVPTDWAERGADWLHVEAARFRQPIDRAAPPRQRIERVHRLAWRVCDFADAHKVEHVFIEGYPNTRAAGLDDLAELGGVLRRDLALRIGCWAETAPLTQSRRMLIGPKPPKGDIEKLAHDAARKLGAIQLDEAELSAWMAANYGLAKLGFPALGSAIQPKAKTRG
jgi:hypothetical protein